MQNAWHIVCEWEIEGKHLTMIVEFLWNVVSLGSFN